MSLLSYNELCGLVQRGVITNVAPEQINAASIDITLGEKILFERAHNRPLAVSLKNRDALLFDEFAMQTSRGIGLTPGQFVLAHSQQVFNLPEDISCEYKLKSSMARMGLEHLNAGWCDAGWNGSVLTLELKNITQYHTILLEKGDRIGQMVFFRHARVPSDRSYAARGSYNGDKTATPTKGAAT